eukprot:5140000-Amphidinium_carterae.1
MFAKGVQTHNILVAETLHKMKFTSPQVGTCDLRNPSIQPFPPSQTTRTLWKQSTHRVDKRTLPYCVTERSTKSIAFAGANGCLSLYRT